MASLWRSWALLLLGTLLAACGRAPAPGPRPGPAWAAAPRPGEGGVEAVPEQARRVLAHVRAHGEAPPDTEGGRRFGNYERRLPERDAQGRPLRYREWDLWPRKRGRNRGPERLVTGSDGRAWYTGDHYRSFTEVRP